MATVTGYTATRMKQIEDSTVVGGSVVDDNLNLTTRAGSTIVAGNVRGPKGDKGDIGPVGITNRGVYNSSAIYAKSDIATYQGQLYISKLAGNQGHTPSLTVVDDGYWIRIVDKGADGAVQTVDGIAPNSNGDVETNAVKKVNGVAPNSSGLVTLTPSLLAMQGMIITLPITLYAEDLNTLRSPGFYKQPSNTQVSPDRNYPPGSLAGSLQITEWGGGGSGNVVQQYCTYTAANRIFVRNCNFGVWSTWLLVAGTTP